ncbi:hypothetical protein ACHAXR_002237 [Thalassiosira sp. AJA248-18]
MITEELNLMRLVLHGLYEE